jgi:ribosomal protein S26
MNACAKCSRAVPAKSKSGAHPMNREPVGRPSKQPGNRKPINSLELSSSINDDEATAILILAIASLITANLLLRLPNAVLAVDQINQMPLLGP